MNVKTIYRSRVPGPRKSPTEVCRLSLPYNQRHTRQALPYKPSSGGSIMSKPKRLPKSEKEQDFDQMMRRNRKGSSSVWEGGTSLKKLASTMSAGQGQSFSASHGGGHTHQTPVQTRRSRSQMQGGVGFGHDRNQGGAGVLPSLSKSMSENRRWVEDASVFNNRVNKNEVGRVFGGPAVSYGMGVSLARQEYDMRRGQKIAKNLEMVEHLMSLFPHGVSERDKAKNGYAAMDMLPYINSPGNMKTSPSKARMAPGTLRVDSEEPEHFLGGNLTKFGVHKPWKPKANRRGY